MESNRQEAPPHPPARTRSVMGDVRAFFLHPPEIPTLLEFSSRHAAESYARLMMQRIGMDFGEYSVLNVHGIGIEAPARYVFEDFLDWSGDSACWPNHVATVQRIDDDIERIHIRPFGFNRPETRHRTGRWTAPILFDLTALRIQRTPGEADPDNGRYLLYACSGGYPIGLFVIYVRSSIAARGETARSQIFMAVGFDFYGKKGWPILWPVHRVWEGVHNRVTANVLNRFKQLSEWRFGQLRAGL